MSPLIGKVWRASDFESGPLTRPASQAAMLERARFQGTRPSPPARLNLSGYETCLLFTVQRFA